MISSVALVLAVVAIGTNGYFIPPVPSYSGYVPYAYSGAPVSYKVSPSYNFNPSTYSVNVPSQLVHNYNVIAPPVAPIVAPVVQPIKYVAPAPIVAPVHYQSQFHVQDEFGGYHFGHSGGPSSRNEIRDHFGNVRGSYNYIDSDGEVQTTHYTAGALGFQVAATNLPVAPVAIPVQPQPPVAETVEVAAARSAFEVVFEKARAETAAANEAAAVTSVEPAATPVRRKRSTPVVAVHGTPNHYPYSFGTTSFATPYAASFTNPYAAQFATPYAAPFATPYAAQIGSPYNFAPRVYNSGFSYNSVSPLAYPAGVHHAVAPFTYSAGVAPLYNAGPVHAVGAAVQNAELLQIANNPGHATSYRVLETKA